MPPKEQVPKRPLEPISQVDELQLDAPLESAFMERHQRGNFALWKLNSQVKGQRRVKNAFVTFLCPFCVQKKVTKRTSLLQILRK